MEMDSLELFRRAVDEGIAIFPGIMCATTSIYNNCIRISCGLPWSERIDQGIATLARLIDGLDNRTKSV
jgi:DNA-binding transcriptional MocR family regulator